jgi:hypothetical protein
VPHLWLSGLQRKATAQGVHRLGASLEAREAAVAHHLHQQKDAVCVLSGRQEPANAEHLHMRPSWHVASLHVMRMGQLVFHLWNAQGRTLK